MALVDLTGGIPTETETQGWIIRRLVARFNLANQRHYHAKARRLPGTAPFTSTVIKTLDWSKSITATAAHAWSNFLSPAQVATWEALAAAHTVQVESGALKTLTGYQLLLWYLQLNYYWGGVVGAHDAPFWLLAISSPPATWTPPATPSALAFTGSDAYAFGIDFTSTPNLNLDNASVSIRKRLNTTRTTYLAPLSRLNVGLSARDPALGLYSISGFFYPVATSYAKLTGAIARIRVMSDYPDLVPSNFAQIALP